MKILGLFLLGLALAGCHSGCTYRAHLVPLQPDEAVLFNSDARAAEFRRASGNDRWGTNRWVRITRPCSVTCE
jgi:hypothetical protein